MGQVVQAGVPLFRVGDFTLRGGKKPFFKIDCDSLTDADWDCLAVMVRRLIGPYKSVQGVPRGGLKLAERLSHHCNGMGPHLIVDDVLTTGGSMEQAYREYLSQQEELVITRVVGCVVFARGPLPLWIKAVFRMPEGLWL